MEISTDPDGRVYVRWHGGGPYVVVDSSGTTTTELGMGGRTEWTEFEEVDDDSQGDYDDGFEAGYTEAIEAARDAVSALGPPSRTEARAA